MRIFSALAVVSSGVLFSGCAGAPVPTLTRTSPARGADIQGKVYGGQTALSGASLYLFAANDTGYGKASISLLNSNVLGQTPAGGIDGNNNYYVTTGADGSFGITGDYTCPSTTSQLYLYATGGNPGLPPGSNNPSIGLLAALGTCQANSTLSPTLFTVINEVSTIATAYAIAGYATDPLHVSSPANALAQTGIANAFATVTNLETLNTGLALATTPAANGGNGTVPLSEIDTLANILAACVNSSGPGFTPCSTLFSNAMNSSIAPTDTATAALNIAHNPGANIGNLFALQAGSSPFQPDMSAAPNDFTIAISFTGGGLSEASDVAVDASGNIWAANLGGANGDISELNPLGKPLSGSGYTGGGIDEPLALAIDASGNIWSASGNNSLNELSSTGAAESGSGFIGGGLNNPCDIAIDAASHIWVANCGSSDISEFSTGGSSIAIVTGGGLSRPDGVAIDAASNVWVANGGNDTISEFNSSGTANGGSPFSGGGLIFPSFIAVDASGNVWAANDNFSVSEFSSGGSPNSGTSGDSGGGLAEPVALAIDGAGNVWAADDGFNSADVYDVSELNSSGAAISGYYGYIGGSLGSPDGIAIDGSGNVWVANNAGSNLTEFVGAAAPVVTPVVANLLAPYGSSAVNKP